MCHNTFVEFRSIERVVLFAIMGVFFIWADVLSTQAFFPILVAITAITVLGIAFSSLFHNRSFPIHIDLLLGAWFLSLLPSVFVSTNTSLSLYKLMYVVVFLLFFVLLRFFFSPRQNAQLLVFWAFLSFGVFLAGSGLSSFRTFFSSETIFFFQYGHAHFDFVVLPAIVLALFSEKKVFSGFSKNIRFFFLVVLFLAGIISGSQVTWLLLFLIAIFFCIKQKKWLADYQVFPILFLTFLGFITSLSVIIISGVNARSVYWAQSWQALQAAPVFGFGAGVYGEVIQRFAQTPYSVSLFAHNLFLEMAIESGWIANFLWGVICVVAVLQSWWQKKEWGIALTFSFLLIFTKMWFDYDFSLLPNALVVASLLAILFPVKKQSSRLVDVFFRLWIIFLGFCGVIYAILWITTSLLLSKGFVRQSFSLFPYYLDHMSIYVTQKDSLTENQRGNLDELYWSSPTYLRRHMSDSVQIASWRRIDYYQRLVQIDRWDRLFFIVSSEYVHEGMMEEAEYELIETVHVLQDMRQQGFEPEYSDVQKIAWHMEELSFAFLQQGQVDRAVLWLEQRNGVFFDPMTYEFSLSQSKISSSTKYAFLAQLGFPKPEIFGENVWEFGVTYAEWLASDIRSSQNLAQISFDQRVEYLALFPDWMQQESYWILESALEDRASNGDAAEIVLIDNNRSFLQVLNK